jgi:multimeric flavodoxin WrbA
MKQAITKGLVEKKGRTIDLMKVPRIFSGDPEFMYHKKNIKKWYKPERVLILNASPRMDHGYTANYESMFLEPFLNDKDIKTEHYFLAKLKMKQCQGCFYCQVGEIGKCVIQDDLSPILDRYFEYDLVILSSPIYVGYLSTLAKTFIERTFRYLHIKYKIQNKKYPEPVNLRDDLPKLFLFMIGAYINAEIFKPIIKTITSTTHFEFTDYLGIPASMVWVDQIIKFKKMEELGIMLPLAAKDLIRTGKINDKLKKRIEEIRLDFFKYMNTNRCLLDFETEYPNERSKFKYVPRKQEKQTD